MTTPREKWGPSYTELPYHRGLQGSITKSGADLLNQAVKHWRINGDPALLDMQPLTEREILTFAVAHNAWSAMWATNSGVELRVGIESDIFD